MFSCDMDRRELLSRVTRLGRAFRALGLEDQAHRLRLYWLAVRHGVVRGRNEVDVKWNEKLVEQWLEALRLPPFEDALPVRAAGAGCGRCGVAQGTVPSGRTELVFPGGARLKCQTCGQVWLELDGKR
jgi:hypothetical protein